MDASKARSVLSVTDLTPSSAHLLAHLSRKWRGHESMTVEQFYTALDEFLPADKKVHPAAKWPHACSADDIIAWCDGRLKRPAETRFKDPAGFVRLVRF